VTAAAVPVKFVNPAFMLVPLPHGTNKLVDWVSSFEGIKPFIENPTEHPTINYRHVPVKSLYELRVLIQDMDDFLPLCQCPALILQGNNDPVVSIKSAQEVIDKIGSKTKRLKIVNSKRHGILMENIDGTWELINQFMAGCLDETMSLSASLISK
jgi:esterase/lipase